MTKQQLKRLSLKRGQAIKVSDADTESTGTYVYGTYIEMRRSFLYMIIHEAGISTERRYALQDIHDLETLVGSI